MKNLGGKVFLRCLLERFTETVNDCGLIDLGFIRNEFTWEKSKGSKTWVQERLDRGLANRGWRNLFSSSEVKVLDMSTSDHIPLFLQLNIIEYVSNKKRFPFEIFRLGNWIALI